MTTETSTATPILIVGAGPTGLVMAIELARRTIPFRLIDVSRSVTDQSKAIGIQARTLELFDSWGIADEFTALGNKCTGANVYHDKERLAHISIKGLDSPFPYILLLPQSQTERILMGFLESLGGTVEREVSMVGFTQTANGVTANLHHPNGSIETINTQWVIGCDGSHSSTRHLLDLPFQGADYEEGFLLADVKVDWANQPDELYVYTHEGWILAAFALTGGRWRLIANLPPLDAPVDQTPTMDAIQKIVSQRCPIPAVISDPLWTANYRIHRRIVSRLREGHVFLVGDAAHIHSPAGAQGMNTGIQDAANLAWKLALAYRGNAGEDLLNSYHDERYPVEKSVLEATNVPLQLLGLKNQFIQSLRDAAASFVTGFDVVQSTIGAVISELAIHYPQSEIVEEHSLGGGPSAGQRAPDAVVGVSQEQDGTLFDLLRGPEFKLLLFEAHGKFDDYSEIYATLDTIAKEHLGTSVKVHHFASPETSQNGAPHGSNGQLFDRYYARQGAAYLIRPDGYIGFRSAIVDSEERFRAYLDTTFAAMSVTDKVKDLISVH